MMSSRYPARARTTLTDTVITIDGHDYILTIDAYVTDVCGVAIYEAKAIRADEHPDSDGYQPIYRLQWDILADWDGDDEADACDWSSPAEIAAYDLALME